MSRQAVYDLVRQGLSEYEISQKTGKTMNYVKSCFSLSNSNSAFLFDTFFFLATESI